MVVPFILFLISIVGVVSALVLPEYSDLILIAGPCALAAAILLLRARSWKSSRAPKSRRPSEPAAAPNWIVVDGSNVMYWRDNSPQLAPVKEILAHLTGLGFTPGVVFDANAGYLLTGRYMHHGPFSRLLGLPEDRVMVVQKGTQADTIVLAAARDLGARVVSNDRYRDWAEQHPEVRNPGQLIRGGYRDGRLWLDLDRSA